MFGGIMIDHPEGICISPSYLNIDNYMSIFNI
jgi:hypothetical protein